jgi:hypothetical protein
MVPSNPKTKKLRKKKGGSSPPAKRRKTEKKVWSELPKEHQILCKKFNPKNLDKLADKCRKYEDMDLWVHNSYGIQKVSDEASPLFIFNEKEENNFSDIEDGIHNFILFWDETSEKYTLATAYFNAFEFGSKHNIISYRTTTNPDKKTPDTFIISGEIKKEGSTLRFHDTSSQFFQDNLCNIKRQMPIIYLSGLIDELDIDIDTIDKTQLAALKRMLFATNVYEEKYMRRINQAATLDELVQAVSTYLPLATIEESVIHKSYVELIQHILADAFEHLFRIKVPVEYVKEFAPAEYGDQINVKEFTQQMCRLRNPIPFDVYFTENDCTSERKKSRYNTCHLDDITEEYMAEMKKESPEKSSPEKSSPEKIKSVYVNGEKLSIDQIRSYWPNYTRFRDVEYKDTPETLYETLIKRIQKKEPDAVIEFI